MHTEDARGEAVRGEGARRYHVSAHKKHNVSEHIQAIRDSRPDIVFIDPVEAARQAHDGPTLNTIQGRRTLTQTIDQKRRVGQMIREWCQDNDVTYVCEYPREGCDWGRTQTQEGCVYQYERPCKIYEVCDKGKQIQIMRNK